MFKIEFLNSDTQNDAFLTPWEACDKPMVCALCDIKGARHMDTVCGWIVQVAISGFWLCFDVLSLVLKGNSYFGQIDEKVANETSKMEETPFTVTCGSGTAGGTTAGLFRTPISGGVQSATSAHGLPRPALAVRNLMEQVRISLMISSLST